MKRTGHLIDKIADYDNLLEAYRKACRGKQCKKEVREFTANLDENISLLRSQLLSGHVDVGHYHHFTIYEPKERKICAAAFHERVLHHAIINVCEPYFERTMIDTTYATRRGKGVYAAVAMAMKAITRYRYSVKLDIRKYFDSIDHEVLTKLLNRKFSDPKLLNVFSDIIRSYSTNEGKGLPIGNLTSQYFANYYLSDFDHYLKEQLHIPIYIRYMDDMLVSGFSKEELKMDVSLISDYLCHRLNLTVKPPVYMNNNNGQVFLGYKILPYRCMLSGRSKKRFRTKYLSYERQFNNGIWSDEDYSDHILPLLAFVKHAESKQFRKSCLNITNDILQG